MNFDQFAASFQNPEVKKPVDATTSEEDKGEVVLAGTIVAVTKQSFSIEINCALYEGHSRDVIDLQVMSSTPPDKEAAPKGADKAGAKGPEKAGSKASANKVQAEDDWASRGPQFALVRLNKNAILVQRTPVPATLLAAVGTWVNVVMPPAKAA